LRFQSLEKSRDHEIVPNTVYQNIETNELFQGEIVFIFFMTQATTLAPARTIDWDAVGQLVKNDILQALAGEEQFMASANEREQCFHPCMILRIGRIPAVPYSVIGRLLSLDKGLARRQFKWGIAHRHGPVRMDNRRCYHPNKKIKFSRPSR
jgi:hypothetical protein